MPVFENIGFEGIEGTRVGKTNRALNTSCIVYRLGDTIIDTGPGTQWEYVKQFIEERDVARVMITHHHEDHSGNGARIQKEISPPIFMPKSGIDLVRSGFNISFMQNRAWGKFQAFQPKEIPDEMHLQDGIILRSIHAPGHSHDMTCYLEPNRVGYFRVTSILPAIRNTSGSTKIFINRLTVWSGCWSTTSRHWFVHTAVR